MPTPMMLPTMSAVAWGRPSVPRASGADCPRFGWTSTMPVSRQVSLRSPVRVAAAIPGYIGEPRPRAHGEPHPRRMKSPDPRSVSVGRRFLAARTRGATVRTRSGDHDEFADEFARSGARAARLPHALDPRGPGGRGGRRAARPEHRSGRGAAAVVRPEPVRRERAGAALAGVPPAVRRPHADRAAGRRAWAASGRSRSTAPASCCCC